MSEEDEVRARIQAAVAIHGAASARLNPDGTIDVVVPESAPTNDLQRARERKANGKKKWRAVTNDLVVSHADPDCKTCAGQGFTGPDDDGEPCKCAEELFEVHYRERLRWNTSKHRVEVFV